MSLGDIYNFIEKIQNTIGSNCRVYLYVSSFNTLEIRVEWLDANALITYVKAFSEHELRYIQDEKILIDWFCFLAIRYHKVATVGEE